MASGFVSWTTPDGTTPNPVYIDDNNKSVEFSARENTITSPVGSVTYTLSNLGVINGFQCYKYVVYTAATTTTTTTTTEPPEITLSSTGTCVGGALDGNGRIIANGFSGGSGTYSTIRIGTSMQNAFEATPINLSGATSYQFDNLNSALWYILLTDSLGNEGYHTQNINCTNTTTLAPTTSTTTQASTTTTTSTSTTSTSTSTTTGAPVSFNLSYNASSAAGACSAYPTVATYYAPYGTSLGNGTGLFTSTALSTTVTNGYYSNGTSAWTATSGILNSQVSCTDPCGFVGGTAVWTAPATTTTTSTTTTTTTTTAAPPPPPTTAPPPPPTTAPPPPPTTAPPPPPTTAPPPPPPTTAPPPPPPPSYFYYNVDYCSGGSAGVARFTVDQVVGSVFDLGSYVCVTITSITSGPSYTIDLGGGMSYVGSNCSSCPTPPPPPPPPPSYDYYDYEKCVNPNAYEGPVYSIGVISGGGYPPTIVVDGDCYSIYSTTPTGTPTYPTPSYTIPGSPCSCV